MKKNHLIIVAFCLFLTAAFSNEVFSFTNGAPAQRSGGPGEATCATSSCHAGPLNAGSGTMSITSSAPGNVYTPGMTYQITVRMEQAGINRFGFEVLSAYSATSNSSVGTTTILNSSETKLLTSGQRRYVTQVTGGSLGTGVREWTFEWTAPANGSGDVEFFGAANAANNNGGKSGDDIYTTSLLLTQMPVGLQEEAARTALEVFPTMATDEVILRLSNARLKHLEAHIIDQSGQVVEVRGIQPIGTEVRERFSVADLAAGVYYLSVVGAELPLIQKFVKF